MPERTLNLGILAHIDAGKTSLTERLLYDHGVIDRLGSVDAGDTQTDRGDLERERGITIRSAVAAFALDDLQVNLVDTPGHPDFIAEVERALSVLDGAVLVVSAVEGVQAQTRVLMRSLRRLGLPTIVFVNKIDRMGARYDTLLADIRRKLVPHVVPMTAVRAPGTADAETVAPDEAQFRARTTEILADHDDALLARFVAGSLPGRADLERRIARLTATGVLHPVYFGSARSGQGVDDLTRGIATFLPPASGDRRAEPTGTVFAVERGPGGEKTAFLRLFAGELRERQRVVFHRPEPDGGTGSHPGRITGLAVVGAEPGRRALVAGQIGRLRV
ncbi:GTP-binding protein, partial [Micromonospora zhanjiangensis]